MASKLKDAHLSSDTLKLRSRLNESSEGGALSNENVAYSKWLQTNTGVKLYPNGQRETVWKTGPNKGKEFNPEEGKTSFNREFYGTATPKKDLKYLKAVDDSKLRIKTLRNDSIRTRFSGKDYLGKNIYQQEVDQKESKAQESLEKLRIGTKFDDPKYKAGTDEYILANPEEYPSYTVRQAQKNLSSNSSADQYEESASTGSDQINTSTATKNTSQSAAPVSSADNDGSSPVTNQTDQLRIRSDVHTIDPATGERLGVMTNRQREAWEKDPKNQKYLQDSAKNKNNLRIYKDKKGNTTRTAGGDW
tara:strand:+ start:39 stop:953 length:915 start_codon:yes stop_codon:yes gene_type:complete